MDMDGEVTEYERIRQRNIMELQEMMSELSNDVVDSMEAINYMKEPHFTKTMQKKRKRSDDETFRFTGAVPMEIRKSARLSNITPQFTYLDLPDDDYRSYRDKSEVDDLEEVVYRKRPIKLRRTTSAPCEIVPVEDITSKYLANIANRVTVKVYSQSGTSCHQCRQKTLDSKTYCRSGRCIGVRGRFCGVCLKNRYGEEAKDALLDSNWECPPCRGLCNCSICRTREGKRPTGILAPVAFKYGHKSVKDFLISLKGEGDYIGTPRKKIKMQLKAVKKLNCSPEGICDHLLLGFNNGNPIWVTNKTGFCFCDQEDELLGFNSDAKAVMYKNYL